jgi:hypothetical protein
MRPDKYGLKSYGLLNGEVCAVSLQHDSSGDAPRTAREVFYWVRRVGNSGVNRYRFELVRGYYGKSISGANYQNHCYHNRNWYSTIGRPGGQGVIAENVAGFKLFVPDPDDPGAMTETFYSDPNLYPFASNDRVPEYLDIFLELLSEQDSIRVADMVLRGDASDEEIQNFVEKKARRFTARVQFYNRAGYGPR